MGFKLRKPNPKGEFRISLGSIKGYKSDSPDRDNDVNIIHSKTITMEGVPHDVVGTDNKGVSITMEPGKNYEFPGDKVIETPVKHTFKGLLSGPYSTHNRGHIVDGKTHDEPWKGKWNDPLDKKDDKNGNR